MFKGYVNEMWLLIISMFSEPIKPMFVNKLPTYVLVHVFKVNDGNKSSIASISVLLWKLGISKSPKNSTDLSNELKVAIGWEPSMVFCKK